MAILRKYTVRQIALKNNSFFEHMHGDGKVVLFTPKIKRLDFKIYFIPGQKHNLITLYGRGNHYLSKLAL